MTKLHLLSVSSEPVPTYPEARRAHFCSIIEEAPIVVAAWPDLQAEDGVTFIYVKGEDYLEELLASGQPHLPEIAHLFVESRDEAMELRAVAERRARPSPKN